MVANPFGDLPAYPTPGPGAEVVPTDGDSRAGGRRRRTIAALKALDPRPPSRQRAAEERRRFVGRDGVVVLVQQLADVIRTTTDAGLLRDTDEVPVKPIDPTGIHFEIDPTELNQSVVTAVAGQLKLGLHDASTVFLARAGILQAAADAAKDTGAPTAASMADAARLAIDEAIDKAAGTVESSAAKKANFGNVLNPGSELFR